MKSFKISRAIPASPQMIFDVFRHPELLAKWWGPAGFTNTFHLFQFEQGGKWSFTMHGPDGKSYPNESEFLEIVFPEKIFIQHVSEPRFTLTITIEATENDSIIHWVQEFENEQVAKSIAHIVEPSNEQNLDRLTAVACGG